MLHLDRLQYACSKFGIGLDLKWMEKIRKDLVNDFMEVALKSGYSYYTSKNGKDTRLLKLAVLKDKFFIEFNVKNVDLKDITGIMFLNNDDRKELHAGRVEFCFVGEDFVAAEGLIKKCILAAK